MSWQPPDDGDDSGDAPPSVTELGRIWAAFGVSAAAGLHVVVAALVLINRSH